MKGFITPTMEDAQLLWKVVKNTAEELLKTPLESLVSNEIQPIQLRAITPTPFDAPSDNFLTIISHDADLRVSMAKTFAEKLCAYFTGIITFQLSSPGGSLDVSELRSPINIAIKQVNQNLLPFLYLLAHAPQLPILTSNPSDTQVREIRNPIVDESGSLLRIVLPKIYEFQNYAEATEKQWNSHCESPSPWTNLPLTILLMLTLEVRSKLKEPRGSGEASDSQNSILLASIGQLIDKLDQRPDLLANGLTPSTHPRITWGEHGRLEKATMELQELIPSGECEQLTQYCREAWEAYYTEHKKQERQEQQEQQLPQGPSM